MTSRALDNLLVRFESGDRGALARVLSLVENEHPGGEVALQRLARTDRQAQVVGVTGPPGAGKSSLISSLIPALRETGETVGVIAVDPSSRITGGAALGDRVRMLNSWEDPGVYIRSMATRGQRGGLARAVAGSIDLLDAFGFDVVVLETVGVGQDEIDVASVADSVVLLQVPGMGDGVQAIKAGVLEVADIYIVNKSDMPGADDLAWDLNQMVRLNGSSDWTPPVLLVSSTDPAGITELIQQLDRHQAYLQGTSSKPGSRKKRIRAEAIELAVEEFKSRLHIACQTPEIAAAVSQVERGERSTSELAVLLIQHATRPGD